MDFGTAKPLQEKIWFELFQPLLLKIVNTGYGRDLLNIRKDFPRICRITNNSISTILERLDGKVVLKTQFHSHAKHGELIRARWWLFRKYAKSFYEKELYGQKILIPVLRQNGQLVAAHTTDTFYPDPNPETTSCDGRLYTVGAAGGDSWATVHDAASASTVEDDGAVIGCHINMGTTADFIRYIVRSQVFFDTSSIVDTDTINSGTVDLFGSSKQDDVAAIAPSINLFGSTSSSTTALTGTDFAAVNTTAQATKISYASWSTSAYNTFTLNASGIASISKTGLTRYSIRESEYDSTNTPPTWTSATDHSIYAKSADTALTTSDPLLTVVHTALLTDALFFGQDF